MATRCPNRFTTCEPPPMKRGVSAMVITAETTIKVMNSWLTIPSAAAEPTRMKLNSPICPIPRAVSTDV